MSRVDSALETSVTAPNPPHDCPLCPRLVEFRLMARQQFPDWHNGPVDNWGDAAPRLMIVGLAPGLRGANRTGRPFTGDYAGDLLYATLKKFGLAVGEYRADPADGLALVDTMIVNSVRCVPPQNKPTGGEIATCRRFLDATIRTNPQARTFFALGRIAHESLLSTLGERRAAFPFAHGAEHVLSDGRRLVDSYHCSRYNTNTGRLTPEMFEAAMGRAAQWARH
ncbi:uracil-DNA glycosylase [Pelagibacterium lacus]|uniref:Type-5 uracil-DNA glycosylase n=1 Tax=Pelagibacterium lacus TaxID=2282655 RepID=A0A369W4Q2_9HYPH|nr:uracil-DNA glycosylase [Pelagibacterium lacus]RDE08999.1 uracil-DNA glycosylase [Pelagibacterium lacus]